MKKFALLLLPIFLLLGGCSWDSIWWGVDFPTNTETFVKFALKDWYNHNQWECYAKFGRIWERDFAKQPGQWVLICYGDSHNGTPVEVYRSVFEVNADGKGYNYHTP